MNTKEINKAKVQWSDERANEVLTHWFLEKADWLERDRIFWYYRKSLGWDYRRNKRYLRKQDRIFWKKYAGYCGGEIKEYLVNKFQLDGFTKIVHCSDWDNFEIEFKQK